jgi:uroporphyrinogen III methyltransferase/synthase
VGAGPGDPGLLTVEGTSLLGAGVIVVDRLARWALDSDLMRALLSSPDPPEIIDVGKAPNHGGWPQERINALLIERARAGESVVRLKGGDPFIFGRGHEELRACREAGIRCTVVPGVSSVTAAPALAGISPVLRGVSASCHVMTGHLGETPGDDGSRWRAAGKLDGTLVILMAMDRLRFIGEELIAGGRAGETPCAIIENASLPGQRVSICPLRELGSEAERAGAGPPAVVVIGEVVNHRIGLEHLDRAPLVGKRIAVTSPPDTFFEITAQLERLGAECESLPMFRYQPLVLTTEELDGVLSRAKACDHLLFTSARAVKALRLAIDGAGIDVRRLGEGAAVAVGAVTAQTLEIELGIRPVIHAPQPGGEALRDLLVAGGARRVMWLRGREGRAQTREAIEEAGVAVEEAVVYESVAEPESPRRLRELLERQSLDAVVFKSPRAVEAGLGGPATDRGAVQMDGVCLAAIGPTTAAAIESLGLGATVVASEPTDDSLAEAVAAHFDPGRASE